MPAPRNVVEIIIHCTATKPSVPVSMDDIANWHKDRKFNGIGYHYVIDTDGKVMRGRPESEIGAHCEGHNARSIGIAYIGGCDNITGKPSDTRTVRQKQSILMLCLDIISRYDIKTIESHSTYGSTACPCFNAGREYYHLLPELA